AACQDLFNALPVGFAPLLQGWHVTGNFATQSSVSFDARQPQKSSVRVKIENGCRVQSVPYEVSPARFEQPFVLEVENEQGIFEPTSFGPGTWGYTPLAAISPYIESAVLVCEDGRFLHHDGFDREAIQNSVRENLRAGRFARGASTISMQLAKNLYLRRDKTISRKLQEAALTMLLEQSFSKRQLLELYLNVIEFGPGLYGIGPAAKHYFETTPDRLTLAQCFFLISILPNPKLSHFGADGHVHAGRLKYLRMLMTIAQKRGHFSQAELDAGLEEQLIFRVPGNPSIAPSRRILQEPGAGFDDELSLPELPEE
ncbi:MAG TPA: biosynthetic peptidoglycan transglycosylase, partial [Polyangiaceae bacterium]|nr:biosynthetic peptidoglycan transglycosylase [Polyangiaceae bacterium]